MALWNSVARAIAESTGRRCDIAQLAPLMGGRVSNAYLVADGTARYFVKVQNDALVRGYAWEARSLRSIAAAGVRTPAVIATGTHGTRAFIVLEYVEPARPPAPAKVAEALIRLHANTAATFGADANGWVGLDRLHRDGASSSGAGEAGYEELDNTPSESWVDFWCERRLRARLSGSGATAAWDAARPRIAALLPAIREGLAGHRPTPALLHGDLNTVNWLAGADGSVLFIDPAIWYGDPEVDLAALAGGSASCREAFDAYVRASPRPDGLAWRLAVYQLWYLLSCKPVAAEPILTETLGRIERG